MDPSLPLEASLLEEARALVKTVLELRERHKTVEKEKEQAERTLREYLRDTGQTRMENGEVGVAAVLEERFREEVRKDDLRRLAPEVAAQVIVEKSYTVLLLQPCARTVDREAPAHDPAVVAEGRQKARAGAALQARLEEEGRKADDASEHEPPREVS